MEKELMEKYNKKTERILKECYDIPSFVAFIIGIVALILACIASKDSFGTSIFIVIVGILVAVVVYYLMNIPLCNLYQNYKKNQQK